ncbi:MAG: SDR family NAD(P)-dependent oxidoreductase [Legionellaceae bacterium]|nr:SDR family NAD(P)-dependent oxidoreductase [Legionellaceae bacterium]
MYILTGGGSGLGRCLASSLANRGQDVLIVGRHKERLMDVANISERIHFYCADITKSKDRSKIISLMTDRNKINGLINCAGVIRPIEPIVNISEENWRSCMATNLDAPLFLSQGLKDKLQNGRILNIGSAVAYFPVVGWSAYCVSKAGLSMLTKCWQIEDNSVAMASVMPGIIDTDMQREIRESNFMEAEKRDYFLRLQKEKKLLKPEVVASFLTWLLLDIDRETYISQEWDIYDKSHHSKWLNSPHIVPDID